MFPQKNSVAINFSDHSLEALELVRDKGFLVVKTQSRQLLESGVIEDGKIIQVEKLRDAVKRLLSQAKQVPLLTRDVVITLPESKVFIAQYSFPRSLNAKQIPAALFSQAKETIPMDVLEAAADFQETGRSPDAVQYLFAATYAQLVDEYLSFFQSLHLRVHMITMESLALGAAVLDEKKEETVLLLDIGARTTIASIFKNGELQESINIRIAGNAITAALAEKLKISPADAEQKKMEAGLAPGGEGAAMLVIQGQMQPLKDELLVFIKYYERKMHDTIDRVLLAGGTAGLFGLGEYFTANLGLVTTVAEPLPIFQITMDRAALPKFLVALGLARIALGDRRDAINFLRRKEKDWLPSRMTSAKSFAKAPTRGGKRVTMPPVRIRLMIGVLIVALGIFGWIFWRRGTGVRPPLINSVSDEAIHREPPLNVILKPFSAQKDYDKSLTFIVAVSLDSKTVQTGDIEGIIETVTIAGTVSYDAGVRDLARRKAGLSAAAIDDSIANALKHELVSQLWESKRDATRAEREKGGRFFIPSYIDYKVAQADIITPESASNPIGMMRLNVSYRALFLKNKDAYQQLENRQLDVFEAANPNLRLDAKNFSFSELTNERVQVVALYTFKRQ